MVQQDWKKIGIRLNFTPLEFQSLIDGLRERNSMRPAFWDLRTRDPSGEMNVWLLQQPRVGRRAEDAGNAVGKRDRCAHEGASHSREPATPQESLRSCAGNRFGRSSNSVSRESECARRSVAGSARCGAVSPSSASVLEHRTSIAGCSCPAEGALDLRAQCCRRNSRSRCPSPAAHRELRSPHGEALAAHCLDTSSPTVGRRASNHA